VTLASVIDRFATGIYAVTRQELGAYDEDGRAIEGGMTELSIRASVQPVTGQELKVLPEARHGEELRAVYTTSPLRTHGPAGAADRLLIDGAVWEVIRAEEWPSHCCAYVARVVSP
jgi:hypothetical protein